MLVENDFGSRESQAEGCRLTFDGETSRISATVDLPAKLNIGSAGGYCAFYLGLTALDNRAVEAGLSFSNNYKPYGWNLFINAGGQNNVHRPIQDSLGGKRHTLHLEMADGQFQLFLDKMPFLPLQVRFSSRVASAKMVITNLNASDTFGKTVMMRTDRSVPGRFATIVGNAHDPNLSRTNKIRIAAAPIGTFGMTCRTI